MPIPSHLPHHSSGSLCLEYLQHPAAAKMVDEIPNPVGVHKPPFKPFTSIPNVPTHTLIVGIQLIFPATTDIKLGQQPSPNSVGDKGKIQVDKEDAEEEEESDDSDLDEDGNTDEEDGSNENSEEDNEDDEGEDNSDEEEEDEDEDEEEEEEYDNHYSDDDFGQDTYGDDDEGLVIEFEESSEVEEEEVRDGADVGKGKGGEKSSAPSTPRGDSAPFWFSHEEPEQLRLIFDSYSTTLEIEEQRKQCIRAPAPFIGRIKRTQVEDEPFTTLDEVEVYLREIYPLGTMLPLSRTDWVLTSWDPEEGVPTKIVKLTKQMRKFWKKRAHGHSSSYLYCSPLFQTKEEYTYDVSSQGHDVMYTSDSPTYTSVTRFSPFLPERCREVTFSRD